MTQHYWVGVVLAGMLTALPVSAGMLTNACDAHGGTNCALPSYGRSLTCTDGTIITALSFDDVCSNTERSVTVRSAEEFALILSALDSSRGEGIAAIRARVAAEQGRMAVDYALRRILLIQQLTMAGKSFQVDGDAKEQVTRLDAELKDQQKKLEEAGQLLIKELHDRVDWFKRTVSVKTLSVNSTTTVSGPRAEGVYEGTFSMDTCPEYAERTAAGCTCASGFMAYQNRCIVATSYCLIRFANQATWSEQKKTCECSDGYIMDPFKKECVSNFIYCTDRYGDSARWENQNFKCGCVPGTSLSPKTGKCTSFYDLRAEEDARAKQAQQTLASSASSQNVIPATSAYFLGKPKTRADVLKCKVIVNRLAKLYYLSTSAYIKTMRLTDKECIANESDAVKLKYRKVK
jgi:hypothetical protein